MKNKKLLSFVLTTLICLAIFFVIWHNYREKELKKACENVLRGFDIGGDTLGYSAISLQKILSKKMDVEPEYITFDHMRYACRKVGVFLLSVDRIYF